MTKRTILAATVAAMTLVSSVAWASLYAWNDAKRPPISLADALDRAEKLLGDDAANRYCVSVSLFGDETGDGKEGAWNLWYAAADGSKKLVYIDMQGESDVELWNGPIDWNKNDGRRTDLADVRRRLEQLFAKERMKAAFEVQQDRLLVTYNVREFQVYPKREDGSYADELEKFPGPADNGIWLEARIVDKPDRRDYGYDGGPYWKWVRGTYVLTQPGRFLSIDLRYGPNVNYEVVRQVWDIFGEPTNDG